MSEVGSNTSQPFNGHSNPYKAQRSWPPDFSKMNPKEQFRLERRYRRRSKLAYTRPRWTRGVKLAQYVSVLGVLGYSVLFMDWGTMPHPFGGVRQWLREKSSMMWTASTTQPQRPNLGRISTIPSTDKPSTPKG
ncbi:hypothetical protein MMC13_000813 [Lambiella insularis]|nr:hypothetical protein [Lambiella insularis]